MRWSWIFIAFFNRQWLWEKTQKTRIFGSDRMTIYDPEGTSRSQSQVSPGPVVMGNTSRYVEPRSFLEENRKRPRSKPQICMFLGKAVWNNILNHLCLTSLEDCSRDFAQLLLHKNSCHSNRSSTQSWTPESCSVTSQHSCPVFPCGVWSGAGIAIILFPLLGGVSMDIVGFLKLQWQSLSVVSIVNLSLTTCFLRCLRSLPKENLNMPQDDLDVSAKF